MEPLAPGQNKIRTQPALSLKRVKLKHVIGLLLGPGKPVYLFIMCLPVGGGANLLDIHRLSSTSPR